MRGKFRTAHHMYSTMKDLIVRARGDARVPLYTPCVEMSGVWRARGKARVPLCRNEWCVTRVWRARGNARVPLCRNESVHHTI